MGNQRFGLYGFFGAIALVLLMNNLMGCASPASAEAPRPQIVTTISSNAATAVEPAPGILGLLDLPPGEYIADTSDVYVDGDTTVTVEDTHITIY